MAVPFGCQVRYPNPATVEVDFLDKMGNIRSPLSCQVARGNHMIGQNEEGTLDTTQQDGESRQRSSISFPYTDLNSAVRVAKAIYGNNAGGECDDDQLAAWLGLSPKSSGYRVQIYAARMFGVIERSGEKSKLSPLGEAIVDPQHDRAARVAAFLNVQLYGRLFEIYKGRELPPPAALEREIARLGVSEKQKTRARIVFEHSADQAGFFEHGKSRLVKPGLSPETPDKQPPADNDKGGGGKGGDGGSGTDSLHPLITGLVATLPKKDEDGWPLEKRIHWLQIAVNTFSLLYGSEHEGEIEILVRPKRKPEQP